MLKKNSLSIDKARNLGPISAKRLNEIGIFTLSDLKERGWKHVMLALALVSEKNINLNFARALIGAELDVDWRNIPGDHLYEAQELLKNLKK